MRSPRFQAFLVLLALGQTLPAVAQPPAPADLSFQVVPLHRDAAGDLLPDGAVGQLGSGKLRQLHPHLDFSADGKILVSWSGEEPSVRFWDAATGSEIRRLANTVDLPLCAVALSPDNRTLAVIAHQGVALLLDAETGTVRHRFQAHDGDAINHMLFEIAFAPDGKTLATTDGFTVVQLWDAATAQEVKRLTPPKAKDRPWCELSFAADGRYLTGLGHCWELPAGKLVAGAVGQETDRICAVSADARWMAAFGWAGGLHLRDLATGKPIHDFGGVKFTGERNRPNRLRFAPDGKTLAVVSPSRAVRLFATATGKRLREFPAERGSTPPAVAFAPDGKTVALVREASRIVLWDVAGDKVRLEGAGHHGEFQALALSPDGRYLAAKPKHEALWVWDTAERLVVVPALADLAPHAGLTFTPDGRTLAVWCQGVTFWQIPSGKLQGQLFRSWAAGPFAFSPDGKVLATEHSNRSQILLADVEKGKTLRILVGAGANDAVFGTVERLAFSPDGETLAVAFPADVVLWNWRAGAKLHVLKGGGANSLGFTTDGRVLAACGPDRGLLLWDVATGKLRLPPIQNLSAASPGADGRCALAAGPRGKVQLWELATGTIRWEIATQHGRVSHVAVAARGGLAVTAHEDGTLLVWDVHRPDQPRGATRRPLDPKDLAKLWMDLSSPEAARAYRAMSELAARPGQALPVLKERLPAVYQERLPELQRWLDGLDSPQFKVREQAAKQLEKAGKLAEPALRKLLAGKPTLEVTRRVEGILARLEPSEPQPPDPAWLQALRGVEALERLGTPAAVKLLEEFAAMSPETWVSSEARAALQRLRVGVH
jgi:WD40 repeat protein